METLTNRQLNRATLARQILLERSDTDIVEAVRFLGGLQAQQSPSWDAFVQAHIKIALAEHDKHLIAGFGEGMAQYVGKRIAALEQEVAELRAIVRSTQNVA